MEHSKQYSNRAEFYILLLVLGCNLIFENISIAGMPLQTLYLLIVDILFIVICRYKGETVLPGWKTGSILEKGMLVLSACFVILIVIFAFVSSERFGFCANILALLLICPCLYGRKIFPKDFFIVYSVSSFLTGLQLFCYYLTGGLFKPSVELLLQNRSAVSWLVLSIAINILAFCFQKKGQIWYGGNILLDTFLLAMQKDLPAMVIVGAIPLLLPIFCGSRKILALRAAMAAFLYGFLLCNMSLITGYSPLAGRIVSYDLEISVYLELLLALAAAWFFFNWDKYAKGAKQEARLPKMQAWYRRAAFVYCLTLLGAWVLVKTLGTDETSKWYRMSQIILGDVQASDGLGKYSLCAQMGAQFGIAGIVIVCLLLYIGIVRLHRIRRCRQGSYKSTLLAVAIILLQVVLLPQSMAALPIYVVFLFLFAGFEKERPYNKMTENSGKKRRAR